jgi:hypothetical protein
MPGNWLVIRAPGLWLVNIPEVDDTTYGFHYPSMLYANMGARWCDSMYR